MSVSEEINIVSEVPSIGCFFGPFQSLPLRNVSLTSGRSGLVVAIYSYAEMT